jgi:23S rRNA pseudouridine2457 synthase
LIILFNKPYGVVCQFSPHLTRPTLKNFIATPNVYPAGRLDWDSEGLVLLTDDGRLQHRITHPRAKLKKTYWVQVEGAITEVAIRRLVDGIELDGEPTLPTRAARIDEPSSLWQREPPIRYRKLIPTTWLEIELVEGRNRQIRRMTAATGFPTLRLIRSRIGPWSVAGLAPGHALQTDISVLSKDLHGYVNRR